MVRIGDVQTIRPNFTDLTGKAITGRLGRDELLNLTRFLERSSKVLSAVEKDNLREFLFSSVLEGEYPEEMKALARRGMALLADQPDKPPTAAFQPVISPPGTATSLTDALSQLATAQKQDHLPKIRTFYEKAIPGVLYSISVGFLMIFQEGHLLVREILSRNADKKAHEMATNISEEEIDSLAYFFQALYTPNNLRFAIMAKAFQGEDSYNPMANNASFRYPRLGFLFMVEAMDGSTEQHLGPEIYTLPPDLD
ncbi:MAG: hypothetical protein PHH60_05625 [Candidatus Margulisbacteria bacterium]|nr:hypothetical protein [Candidatus Margulisiibacteriota bacterium]